MQTIEQIIKILKTNPDIKIEGNTIYRKNPNDPSYSGKVGGKTLAKLDFLSKNGFVVTTMEANKTNEVNIVSISIPKETVKIKIKTKTKHES